MFNKHESAEILLAKNLTVTPLFNQQDGALKKSTKSLENIRNVLIKSSRRSYHCQGKQIQNLDPKQKSGMKQNKMEARQDTPKIYRKQNKFTTDNFLENLRKIEGGAKKSDLLEQTHNELNIASRQIDEIRKMIEGKLKNFMGEQNTHKTNARSEVNARFFTPKTNKQLETMQKKYLAKNKIKYKSIKEFEHIADDIDKAISAPQVKTCVFPKKKSVTFAKIQEDNEIIEIKSPSFLTESSTSVSAQCETKNRYKETGQSILNKKNFLPARTVKEEQKIRRDQVTKATSVVEEKQMFEDELERKVRKSSYLSKELIEMFDPIAKSQSRNAIQMQKKLKLFDSKLDSVLNGALYGTLFTEIEDENNEFV